MEHAMQDVHRQREGAPSWRQGGAWRQGGEVMHVCSAMVEVVGREALAAPG